MKNIDPQERKRIRRANLIAFFVELIIVVVYFVIGFGGIANAAGSMNVEGMANSVKTAIIFLSVATLVAAIVFLTVKPLRTKFTAGLAILDIIWVIINVIMYFK